MVGLPLHVVVLLLRLVGRVVPPLAVVEGDVVRRREHAVMVQRSTLVAGISQLVHPLLLTPLVLEPDLDHSHAQTGVLSQLLSHQSGRLGVGVEDVLQHLQLLGGDVGPGPSPLPVLTLLLVIPLALSLSIPLLLLVLLVALLVLRFLWRLRLVREDLRFPM